MNHIIGNQDRERTSKVDTEKWKEHAEYYSNPKNFKKAGVTKGKHKPILTTTLEDILKRNYDGIPRIELKAIETSYINTITSVEYDTLMLVYEAGGWKWGNGTEPTDSNIWDVLREKTCIKTENHFSYGTTNGILLTNSVTKSTIRIITPIEFYESQNITPEMIIE
ncbi:MAG: hypothetical protein ACP5NW_00885, partial [Candidatus Woesearchaeota archaeon]